MVSGLSKSVEGVLCLLADGSISVFSTSIKENEISQSIYGDYLPKTLADGSFRPHPKPTIVGHGLEQLQGSLDKLKAGVSATKLVVTLG